MNSKIEDIEKQAEADFKLHLDELHIDSIKTPDIYNKYLKLYFFEKKLLKALKLDYKKILREQWEYYSGKAEDEVYKKKPLGHKIRPANVDKYLDSDPALQSSKAKMELQEDKLEYIEKLLKVISDRTWNIKHAIDYIKFKNGQ